MTAMASLALIKHFRKMIIRQTVNMVVFSVILGGYFAVLGHELLVVIEETLSSAL